MSGFPPLHRQASLDRSRSRQRQTARNNSNYNSSTELDEVYRQRIDEAYYLRRMREILQDGCQPRPPFPVTMTRLANHVYIGNQKNADDLEELYSKGITHVINCAPSRLRRASRSESPYPPETGVVGFKVIPAEDKEDYNIDRHFEETLEFLEQVKHRNGKALVHCNMGVNRSGAIIASYLMASERRCLLEVIKFLKSKRSLILTNKGFRRQLLKYARMKCLLDPIDDSEKNECNAEYRRQRAHAFSTPQLRRTVAINVSQRPRPRQRSLYVNDDERDEANECNNNSVWPSKETSHSKLSNSFRTFVVTNPKSFDTFDDNDDNEFVVKSLPRNLSRIGGTSPHQNCTLSNAPPYSRRSFSHLTSERGNISNEEYIQKTNNRMRKSIAYITPTTKYTDESDTYKCDRNESTLNDSIHSFQHSNANMNERPYENMNNYSSSFNLTIHHPHSNNSHTVNDFSRKSDAPIISNHYNSYDYTSDSKPQIQKFNMATPIPHLNSNPRIDSPIITEQKSLKKSESRYCKQLKQHFNDFVNRILPSTNRVSDISNSNTPHTYQQTRASGFSIAPIFIKKVEIKPITDYKSSTYQTYDNSSINDTSSHQRSTNTSHVPTISRCNRYRSTAEPSKFEKETYPFSNVKYQTEAISIPRATYSHHTTSNYRDCKNDSSGPHPLVHHTPSYETNNDRHQYRHNAGSLVFIGSRTSILPQSESTRNTSNDMSDADDLYRPTPRRLRAYLRSKTDSEIR